jgi:hypothetical protein
MMNWKGLGRKWSSLSQGTIPAFAGILEENHEKHQASLSLSRDLNAGSPEYEVGMRTIRPQRSVTFYIFWRKQSCV